MSIYLIIDFQNNEQNTRLKGIETVLVAAREVPNYFDPFI